MNNKKKEKKSLQKKNKKNTIKLEKRSENKRLDHYSRTSILTNHLFN